MKKYLFILVAVFITTFLYSQTDQITITKQGIVFQDGEIQNSSSSASAVIPGGGQIENIFAEFSNGIIGDVTNVQWEDHVEFLGIDNYMFKNADKATGHPFGPIQHRNFIISKPVDIATVDIVDFFNTGNAISEIKIKMIASPNGFPEEIYRITLSNVKIIDYRADLDFDPASSNFYFTEKYALTYTSIKMDHFTSNDTVTISWTY